MFLKRKQKGEIMEARVVGNNVKRLMQKNNITLEELAKKIKIRSTVLSEKIEGKREFYIDESIEIGKVFDLTVDEFAKVFFGLSSSDK